MTQIWKKIKPPEYSAVEAYLLKREAFCVGACSKFITRNFNHMWAYQNIRGEIEALLLHNKLSLYPIFSGNQHIPIPRFMSRFLKKVSIHSLQGLKADAERLERSMESQGCRAEDRIDYDLMTLDREPLPESFLRGPSGLVLRKPLPAETDKLFPLQSAYEQEEVVPRGGVFNPASCRRTLEKLISSRLIMAACLGNEIVGKININAVSYNRYQIGGVYVQPEYRGLGIAIRMSAVFLKQLFAEGKGITLFVKKRNTPARSVYHRLGFTVSGDYRICYY